ncbi:hypothetical protein ABU162_04610 [Paenibacillus thiaminolyticus]|uniref:hypothetical protein n=1 Tax=Paenibacillus thiaminolyticus TaxID=49283 RepID=UPI0035A6512E
MGYIESEGTLVGANMKKGGKLVLQIEVTQDLGSREDYYHLRKMIEKNVRFALESQVVQYNVEVNARTEKPIKHYRVDEKGIVSEAKPEGEQVEMELEGVPKEEVPIKNAEKESDKNVVDDFIIAGMAPSYEDLPYDFPAYVQRIRSGETYLKIANELEMSSGKVSEIFDEYRARVAPLAAKWDEWRKGKAQDEPAPAAEKAAEEDAQPAVNGGAEEDGAPTGTVEFEEDNQGSDQEPAAEEADQGAAAEDVDKEELEKFILEHRPAYDDLPLDFPSLLEERLSLNTTWREIANKIGLTSGQFSTRWTAYKKRVAKQMKENGGAA